jgi:hypothetical protein
VNSLDLIDSKKTPAVEVGVFLREASDPGRAAESKAEFSERDSAGINPAAALTRVMYSLLDVQRSREIISVDRSPRICGLFFRIRGEDRISARISLEDNQCPQIAF